MDLLDSIDLNHCAQSAPADLNQNFLLLANLLLVLGSVYLVIHSVQSSTGILMDP